MKTHTFSAVVYREKDIYVAECPEVGTLRGVPRQAKISPEEFMENI